MKNLPDSAPEEYSDSRFWRKIRKITSSASHKVLNVALTLYFCLRDPDTPTWAKTVILGALGYLILPLDAIPDILPGVGLTDDAGTIMAALTVVSLHVKDEHKSRAQEKLERIFPSQ